MKTVLLALAFLGSSVVPCCAQLFIFERNDMMRYTSKNLFDRFEDGRPKVPDDLLEKVRSLSSEKIWSVLHQAGYPNQYEGNWQILHPGKKLVGRAVTAQYMPARPDLSDVIDAHAASQGLPASLRGRSAGYLQL